MITVNTRVALSVDRNRIAISWTGVTDGEGAGLAIPISRQISTQGSAGLTSVDFHYNSQHSQFRDSGMNSQLSIAKSELAAFCRAHGIRRLSVFGSALREDFGPESDVDVLVEFERDRIPGLLGVAGMEIELSAIFSDRKIDLRTAEDLSHYFRQEVVDTAEVQYARA